MSAHKSGFSKKFHFVPGAFPAPLGYHLHQVENFANSFTNAMLISCWNFYYFCRLSHFMDGANVQAVN
jgi:hypothetical protein